MVSAVNTMMIGQNKIDCLMSIYTLAAQWIYHMRPEGVTEQFATDMVIRGIVGTLEQMRKEGIEPGEVEITTGVTVCQFKN